jgi:hypothetical protein
MQNAVEPTIEFQWGDEIFIPLIKKNLKCGLCEIRVVSSVIKMKTNDFWISLFYIHIFMFILWDIMGEKT